MYLQRTSGLPNGHLHQQKKYEHFSSVQDGNLFTSSMTLTQDRHAGRRGSAPLATLPDSRTLYDSEGHATTAFTSSPVSSILSEKSSSGAVFLPNCKMSADFLQLRTDDSRASPVPVRLYLTTSELVKKNAVKHTARNGYCNRGDFTITRYPLRDIEVSPSQVSPSTMMVTLPSCSTRRDGNSATSRIYSSMNGSTGDSGRCKSASPTRQGGVVSVDAYQILPGQQRSVQDWISAVAKSKQKLVMLGQVRQNSRVMDDSCVDHTHHQTPVSVINPARPTSISLNRSDKSLAVDQNRKADKAGYRRSQSGYDFSSVTVGTSSREKLPTTANGRYTPLHHHYSPHPLFSNSSVPQSQHNGIPLRHTPERDSFKLFRRLSLGSGGTYRFPTSPSHKVGKRWMRGGGGDMDKDGKTKGSKTYMYSLGSDVGSPKSSPCPSPAGGSPSLTRRYDSRSPQSTPRHDVLRGPALSCVVSECHDDGSDTTQTPTPPTEARVPPITRHQLSDPLPANSNHGSSNDSSVPPELRDLEAFLTSLPPPSNSPSTSPPSDDDAEDEDTSFQSFLRHKQFRGRKIHVSPRAHSASVSSEALSDSLTWGEKLSAPNTKQSKGTSSTLPRNLKPNMGARTTRTLDRESELCVYLSYM